MLSARRPSDKEETAGIVHLEKNVAARLRWSEATLISGLSASTQLYQGYFLILEWMQEHCKCYHPASVRGVSG